MNLAKLKIDASLGSRLSTYRKVNCNSCQLERNSNDTNKIVICNSFLVINFTIHEFVDLVSFITIINNNFPIIVFFEEQLNLVEKLNIIFFVQDHSCSL